MAPARIKILTPAAGTLSFRPMTKNDEKTTHAPAAAATTAPAAAPVTAPADAPEGTPKPKEFGGPTGPEPTRYGDWERNGRVSDF